MAFRLSGTTNVVLVSRRLQWNHLEGEYLEEVYEGTATAINALRLANISNPDIGDILSDNEGPKWRAVVRYKTNSNILDDEPLFETRVAKNRITLDLFEHPNFRGIDDDEKRAVREALANPVEGQSPALTDPAAITLYQLGLKGVTSYVSFHLVLTVVHTGPYGFGFDINYVDVGKIITSANIAVISQAAANVAASLPDYLSDADDLIVGWLKHPPEVSTVDNSKQSVTYEFEYGHWSGDIYDLAV